MYGESRIGGPNGAAPVRVRRARPTGDLGCGAPCSLEASLEVVRAMQGSRRARRASLLPRSARAGARSSPSRARDRRRRPSRCSPPVADNGRASRLRLARRIRRTRPFLPLVPIPPTRKRTGRQGFALRYPLCRQRGEPSPPPPDGGAGRQHARRAKPCLQRSPSANRGKHGLASTFALDLSTGKVAIEAVRRRREVRTVAAWVWILLIVLIVLLLFGGVGYSRR